MRAQKKNADVTIGFVPCRVSPAAPRGSLPWPRCASAWSVTRSTTGTRAIGVMFGVLKNLATFDTSLPRYHADCAILGGLCAGNASGSAVGCAASP